MFPQIVCSQCMPQLVAACKIKEACINSDKALRTQVTLFNSESTVKIEVEPDTFNASFVKDEPMDELDEFCNVDTPIDYDFIRLDPMRSARRYSSDEKSVKRSRSRPSTSQRVKRDPPPSSFKCYLCNEIFHQRKLKYEHLEQKHSGDELKCRLCRHKSQVCSVCLMLLHKLYQYYFILDRQRNGQPRHAS